MKKVLALILSLALVLGNMGMLSVSAQDDGHFTAAFIGGSITQGAGKLETNGYVAKTQEYYEGIYGADNVTVINAGFGGTGSNLGMFRLKDEVIAYNPDLVFVEFPVNDNSEMNGDENAKMRTMESIVRQLLTLDKVPQIVFLYTASAGLDCPQTGHRAVADYYNIPQIDLQAALQAEVKNSGRPASDYFGDGPHPNADGYKVYSDEILSKLQTEGFLHNAQWQDKTVSKLKTSNPEFVKYNAEKINYYGNWVEETVVGTDGKEYDAIYTTTSGDSVEFDFYGSVIGLYNFILQNGAKAEYSIDYGKIKGKFSINNVDLKENQYKPNVNFFLSNLEPGAHNIRITAADGGKLIFSSFMADAGSVYSTDTSEKPIDDEEIQPIIELDYSNYDNETKTGLANAAEDSYSVTLGSNATLEKKSANGMEYLTLGHNASSDGNYGYWNNGIRINGESMKNQPAQTVETWMRVSSQELDQYPKLYSIARTDRTNRPASEVMLSKDGTIFNRPAGRDYNASDNSYPWTINKTEKRTDWIGNWTHFTTVRQYNSETKEWTFEFYINGVKSNSLSGSGTQERVDETDLILYIGSDYDGNTSLNGDIGEFKVYNGALTAEQIKSKYENSCYKYSDAEKLLLEECNIADGGSADKNIGEIKLTFNDYINPKTVNSGISLTKLDGSAVKGGYNVKLSETNNKTVIADVSVLEQGQQYKLSINSSLKSLNGNSADSQDITFTAVSEETVLFDDDFDGEDYVVGQAAPTNKGFTVEAQGTGGTPSAIVKQTETGDKYIELSTDVKNSGAIFAKHFDTPVSDNYSLVAEVKLRPGNYNGYNNTARNAGQIVDSNNKRIDIAYMTGGYIMGNDTNNTVAGDANSSFHMGRDSLDADGFYNIRMIFKKGTDGCYYAEVYDMSDLTKSPYVKKWTNFNSTGISSFYAAHIYPVTDENAKNTTSEISGMKIYKMCDAKIMSIEKDADSINTLNIAVNNDLSAESIASIGTNITIRDCINNENVKIVGAVYDSENRVIKVQTANELVSGIPYKLGMRSITTVDNAVFVEGTDFVIECDGIGLNKLTYKYNGVEIGSLQGISGIEADYSLTNYAETKKNCVVVIAVYDNGNLVTCKFDNISLEAGQSLEDSVSVTDITPSEGYEAKCFIWDGMTTLTPLYNLAPISYDCL